MRKLEEELLLIPFILLILAAMFCFWQIRITPFYVALGTTTLNFTVYNPNELKINGQPCLTDSECSSNICCDGTCRSFCISPGPIIGAVTKSLAIVDYPKEVNVTRREIKLISVSVKNTGNAKLNNLSVSLENTTFIIKTSPSSAEVQPNSTQLFLVRIEIPNDAEFADYYIVIKAIGDSVSDKKTMKLTVLPEIKEEITELRKERIQRGINDVSILTENLWAEAFKAKTEGYNVTEVFEYLNESKQNIKTAEDYLGKNDFDNAEFYLEEARVNLEEAVDKLAEKGVIETKIVYLNYMLIVFIIVLSVLIIIISKKRLGFQTESISTLLVRERSRTF
jgi:phosphopantetheine adenylyltransferase